MFVFAIIGFILILDIFSEYQTKFHTAKNADSLGQSASQNRTNQDFWDFHTIGIRIFGDNRYYAESKGFRLLVSSQQYRCTNVPKSELAALGDRGPNSQAVKLLLCGFLLLAIDYGLLDTKIHGGIPISFRAIAPCNQSKIG